MVRNLENKFAGIGIGEKDIPDGTHVTIRKSHNPLHLGRPLAVVQCSCGTTYKEKLLHPKVGYYKLYKKLDCPNSGCDKQASFRYSGN